jgi:hypothetical protein
MGQGDNNLFVHRLAVTSAVSLYSMLVAQSLKFQEHSIYTEVQSIHATTTSGFRPVIIHAYETNATAGIYWCLGFVFLFPD